MPPELSIIIPSHSRPQLLREALASIRRYAPEGTEIIVVDDGSPEEAVSRVAAEIPSVRCLRSENRSGFCVSVNCGIGIASGKVIEVLNDDTVVTSGWFDAAKVCFQDPTVGAVAPLVLNIKDGSIDSAGDCYYVGGVAGKRGHGQLLNNRRLSVQCVFGASASSAFYRRDALLQAGGFPESFGAYFEDVDLSFRLHRAGWRILFQPDSRVYHHVSASYGPSMGRLLQHQSQNEERVYWRNLPAAALLSTLPKHIAVLVAKAGRRFEEGNLRHFLCGRLRVLGEISELLRHRRRLRKLGPTAPIREWNIDCHFYGSMNCL